MAVFAPMIGVMSMLAVPVVAPVMPVIAGKVVPNAPPVPAVPPRMLKLSAAIDADVPVR